MKEKRFKLSSSGRLAVSVAIFMLFSSSGFSNGIVAGGDDSHRPGVTQSKSGADVVNIVAPSESGLSHNQYEDFNVSEKGAVFNNSTNGGESQLAGELPGNSNLHGNSATIILNEVISRNPSLLLGKQEIFGMAADYILANPNGITCDGCGFINTNQLSLVVGNPLVEKGTLQGFNTLDNTNSLKIGKGGLVHDSIINLFSPKIDSRGKISTSQDINIITGLNKISADGRVLDSKKATVGLLDSYYLGSMQAGRIRLLSTDKGSGVNLQGEMTADDTINVESKGGLKLEGARLKGGDLTLKGENITSQGALDEVSLKKEKSEGHFFSGNSASSEQKSQVLHRTKLEGRNITLNANNNNEIKGTDIFGENIDLTGRKLDLDGQAVNQHSEDFQEQWKFLWKSNKKNTHDKTQQEGNDIRADNNIKLTSTGEDIRIDGSKIDAGNNLSLSSKRNIIIDGLIETEKMDNQQYHRLESNSLDTGLKEKGHFTQKQIRSELNADNDLGIEANGDIKIAGSKAHAGNNLIIKAGKKNQIISQSYGDKVIDDDNRTYWGGIAGGKNKNNYIENKKNQSSDITADGHVLLVGNDGIKITGSNVEAENGGYFQSKNGDLLIDNAVSYHQNIIDERHGTVFNITKDSNKEKEKKEEAVRSQVKSNANLKLFSGKNIDVVDSILKSSDDLNIHAGDNINVSSYGEKYNKQKENSLLEAGNIAQFSNEDDKNTITKNFGIKYSSDDKEKENVTQKRSVLDGGNITINAGKDVTVVGSDIDTRNGNANISADNISFLASNDLEAQKESHSSTGIGVFFSKGSNGISIGGGANHSSNNKSHEKKKAVVSKTDIAGDLKLNARNKLEQEGAQHNVAGNYEANANSIENRAAESSDSTYSGNFNIGGGVSLSLSMKNSSPNVGANVFAKGGNHTESNTKSNANVTSIQANNNIRINAKEDVYDQGTQYHADNGGIELKANNHINGAAFNKNEKDVFDSSGYAGIQANLALLSQDLTVTGKGKGNASRSSESNSDAIVSDFKAHKDINIQARHDIKYQGASFNSEDGETTIQAGNNININQANNTNKKTKTQYGLGLGVGVGVNLPTGVVNMGAGSAAAGYAVNDDTTVTAKSSNISGKQGINLVSGNDLSLQGTNTSGKHINLKAERGGIIVTSAQDSINKSNFQIGGKVALGAAMNASQLAQVKAKAYGNFDHGYERDVINHNSQLTGENVTLTSKKDTTIKGANIVADRIGGKIGGNLNIETAQNTANGREIGLEAGGEFNSGTLFNGDQPSGFMGVVNIIKSIASGIKTKFNFNYETHDDTSLTNQSGISARDGVNLDVSGKTNLTGAKIESTDQPVILNTQELVNHEITTHSKGEKISVKLPGSPLAFLLSLPGAASDIAHGKIPYTERHYHNKKNVILPSKVKEYTQKISNCNVAVKDKIIENIDNNMPKKTVTEVIGCGQQLGNQKDYGV
ncbi:hemagglutinin repeat-containing protein [Xenorhabdus sp. PB30.3]|uniref:hemagglutinin repeat-containing protein n=1 Tax=Xenorhabdus sp. PB30.3 TaxID=2788941 RepID=UPI001E2FD0DB|nr:hemagglutinin repeat-containing protein [Xenorhabdus sp. PB30.3]MCC8381465.1 hemagglutinin repeat-containing protein [Xenorhabdus sp. PB30.3]